MPWDKNYERKPKPDILDSNGERPKPPPNPDCAGYTSPILTNPCTDIEIAPNPKQAMGDAKIQMQLVPPSVKIALAQGLVEGAEKYGEWNWRDQPIQVMTYVGSLERHMAAWIEGEDVDPDGDGKTHLQGAIASLAIIIDSISCGSALDDRPKVHDKGVLDALKHGSAKSEK